MEARERHWVQGGLLNWGGVAVPPIYDERGVSGEVEIQNI